MYANRGAYCSSCGFHKAQDCESLGPVRDEESIVQSSTSGQATSARHYPHDRCRQVWARTQRNAVCTCLVRVKQMMLQRQKKRVCTASSRHCRGYKSSLKGNRLRERPHRCMGQDSSSLRTADSPQLHRYQTAAVLTGSSIHRLSLQ